MLLRQGEENLNSVAGTATRHHAGAAFTFGSGLAGRLQILPLGSAITYLATSKHDF